MSIKTRNSPKNFVEACSQVGLPPTERQFKKWIRQEGLAFKQHSGRIDVPDKSLSTAIALSTAEAKR